MASNDTPKKSSVKRNRFVESLLWIGQVLLAIYFIAFGALPKFSGAPAQVEMFEDIGLGQWFRYFTGLCELGGAIGLLIPMVGGLAALGLVGVMGGAALSNLFLITDATEGVVVNVVVAVPLLLIAWGRWPETKRLPALLKR
ncbi:DoxX family protein [Salinactinospora qingdaonensis]|uniref:DoxX-like family protein n=1 Tax=Salinactinospora qingdaonensis TaxID=702744 RepID=A0ABP7FT86_9ACTN